MSCTPQGTTTAVLGLCKPAAGETNWPAAINGNWDILDAILSSNMAAGAGITLSVASGVLTITNSAGGTVVRSSLAGLQLSSDATTPNTVIDITAGQAADSTNTSYITGTAFTKTTSTFVVGSGNGGLAPALTITSNTWYHVYASVVSSSYDVFFDTSLSAANKPGGTTAFRRVGSFFTTPPPNSFVMSFSQIGDYFRWYSSVLDVDTTNPGTSAVTASLTVPMGVPVEALFNFASYDPTNTNNPSIYFSDLNAKDEAPSNTTTPLAINRPTAQSSVAGLGWAKIMTNASRQIRYRVSQSSATSVVKIATLGWYDRRGKDT